MNLETIRIAAMDRIDEFSTPSGDVKFSANWWNRQINRVYRFAAQRTGFNVQPVSAELAAGTQSISVDDLKDKAGADINGICWGITRACIRTSWTEDAAPRWESSVLEATSMYDMDDADSGVREWDRGIWDISSRATPRLYWIQWPDFYVFPVPDAYPDPLPDDYKRVLEIWAGIVPTDLTGTDVPSKLPSQFHDMLADGAAAIAQGIDLYAAPQQGRQNIYMDSFEKGIIGLNNFLDGIHRDRQTSIRLDSGGYGG